MQKNEECGLIILGNSKLISLALGLYRAGKSRLLNYAKTSLAVGFIKNIKKELYLSPIKNTSTIVMSAILTNIFFCIWVNKKTRLLDWIMQILLLFIGITGLLSLASWEDIKKTSFILKWLNNHCKK